MARPTRAAFSRYRDFVAVHVRAMSASGMSWRVHTMDGMVGKNFLAWHRQYLVEHARDLDPKERLGLQDLIWFGRVGALVRLLPERPQAIDVGMVQKEDRIRRRACAGHGACAVLTAYVDPRASRGLLYRAYVSFLGTCVAAWLSMNVVWKVDPHLMRLTGGRFGLGLMLPTALLETRGARTGRARRNGVIYFHDGEG
jgi:hypothetical protein